MDQNSKKRLYKQMAYLNSNIDTDFTKIKTSEAKRNKPGFSFYNKNVEIKDSINNSQIINTNEELSKSLTDTWTFRKPRTYGNFMN